MATTGAQPPGLTPTESKGDRELLLQMLETMEETLRLIVHDCPELFPEHLRSFFPGPWPAVERSFWAVRRRLGRSWIHQIFFWLFLYFRLRRVGLTGKMLRFKSEILSARVKIFHRWYQAKPSRDRRLGFDPGRILIRGGSAAAEPAMETMNTIMGSMAKVFPPLEVALEYKDITHSAVREQRRSTEETSPQGA